MPTHDAAAGGATPGNRPASGGSDSVNDGELLQRMERGDKAALAALYDRHSGAVFSLSLRIVGNDSEAERVVEQVFAYAWQQALRYDSARASVAGWLLETARRASIDRVRAGRPAVASGAPGGDGTASVAMEPATLLLPSPAGAPGYRACSPAEAGRLREALAGLPRLQRLTIELAYFEGLTIAQIAGQLEQPEETIHDRLLTGLRNLRGALEDGAA